MSRNRIIYVNVDVKFNTCDHNMPLSSMCMENTTTNQEQLQRLISSYKEITDMLSVTMSHKIIHLLKYILEYIINGNYHEHRFSKFIT